MNIPARLVLRKMDEELAKLKDAVDRAGDAEDYRQYAHSLKAYCDLLLESDRGSGGETPAASGVQKASAEDMERLMMGDMSEDGKNLKKAEEPRKKKQSIYDDGDEPESDSLFDF